MNVYYQSLKKGTVVKKYFGRKFIAWCLVIIIIQGIWESYNILEINGYPFHTSKASNSFKIVVIADLHDHEFTSGNLRLVDKIRTENPDLILMVGDFLNGDSEDARVPLEFIENLGTDTPIYFSLGNHEIDYMDTGHPELIEQLEEAGAVVVEKEYEDIDIDDTPVRIGGMYDYAYGAGSIENEAKLAKPEVKEFLEDFQDTDVLKIMMAHRPDSFIFGDASKVWGIDLVVSGHLHGGQVVLPLLGGLYAGDQGFFPKYIHGMYKKDKMNIFITAGLGSHTQLLPRFNNPPEIAVLNIKKH